MTTTTELDENYVHQESNHNVEPGAFPFFTATGGTEPRYIDCVPAEFLTACTDMQTYKDGSGHTLGVIALANKCGGLASGFTADEMREMAKQLMAMADYVEEANGKRS